MFKIWMSKVEKILQRALQQSEIKKAEELFYNRYNASGAAEYLR